MITISDKEGQLGTIELTGDTLTGSNQLMQRLADSHLAADGSAAAAYAKLSQLNNGYVWAAERTMPPETISSQLAAQ